MGGCSHLPHLSPELKAAAAEQGRAAAGVTLPAYPERCAEATPHAPVRVGDRQGDVLKREQFQLDLANGDKGWCASAFYAPLKARLKK